MSFAIVSSGPAPLALAKGKFHGGVLEMGRAVVDLFSLSDYRRSSHLSGFGKVALVAGIAAGTAIAAVLSDRFSPGGAWAASAGTAATALVVGAQCAVADPAATLLRHPKAFLNLAWLQWHGRGGHIVGVAIGLGLSFALLAPATTIATGVALILGIQPWVAYDAAYNPAHEGRRLEVLGDETLKNVAGSACAALLEPWLGGLLGPAVLAVQFQTLVHYFAVLVGGWKDLGRWGLSRGEG